MRTCHRRALIGSQTESEDDVPSRDCFGPNISHVLPRSRCPSLFRLVRPFCGVEKDDALHATLSYSVAGLHFKPFG